MLLLVLGYLHIITLLKWFEIWYQEAIKESLDTIDQLWYACAKSNKVAHLYGSESYIALAGQPNFACKIGLFDKIINSYETQGIDVHEISKFVKQRSEMWHQIRKTAKVTGSTANVALGLGHCFFLFFVLQIFFATS